MELESDGVAWVDFTLTRVEAEGGFRVSFLEINKLYAENELSQISFEAASALGTVGLSTGITSALTTAGKFIIIVTMLIGRLGPLTLLAALTFNIKPAKYNYPEEAIIVG